MKLLVILEMQIKPTGPAWNWGKKGAGGQNDPNNVCTFE
jgi:hypothetical protein